MNRPAAAMLALIAIAVATTVTVAAVDNTSTRPVAVGPGSSATPTLHTAIPIPTANDTPTISVQVENAAGALGEQGRGPFADIWGALSLDGAGNRVLLYVTDPTRAQAMIDAAHKAHPDTGGVPVKVIQCAFTSRDEHAAVDQVIKAQLAKTLPFTTYGAAPTINGSGILVYAPADVLSSPRKAQYTQELAALAGRVPVHLILGTQGRPA